MLWAFSHEPECRFDAEDARILASLSRFAAAAWQALLAHKMANEHGVLRQAHDELEQRVQERTAELGRVMKRLVNVQEEERRRIARDLHDDIGQKLTALHLKLAAVAARVDSSAWLADLRDAQEFALQLDRDVRFFSGELRSSALYTLGLSAALQGLVESLIRTYGMRIELEVIGSPARRLAKELEVNLYRIAQEALQNVHKHAQANLVDLILHQTDGRVVLTVSDDGRGFDMAVVQHSASGGLGLLGMRERAALIGGQLTIESTVGQGTSIVVSAPLAYAS
jgi:signal transduction histidine kinase